VKTRSIVSVVLVASLIAAACGDDDDVAQSSEDDAVVTESAGDESAEPTGGTYEFGYLDALSGQAVGNTTQQMAGVEACFETVNAEGGVNGKELVLDETDDGGDVGRAVAGFREFARNEGVLGVLGGQLPNTLAAVGEIAGREELVYFAYSYSPALFDPPLPYVFTVDLSPQAQVRGIIEEIARLNEGGDEANVAFFTVDTPSAGAYEEGLRNADGIALGEVQTVGLTATDVSVQAAAIAQSNPDFVVLYGPEPFMILALTGLRQRGVEVPAITATPASRESTFEALANQDAADNYHALRYGVMASDVDEPAAELMREAAAEINWTGGLGGLPFTGGWMQCVAIVKALEACGADCDRESFRDELESIGEIDSGPTVPMVGASFSPDKHSLATTGRFSVWDAEQEHTVPADDSWVTLVEE
jgi:ABC-type branched-subunit amino acid transport system substrate-binding protein